MTKVSELLFWLLQLSLFLLGDSGLALALSSDFYSGKTVTLSVGNAPDGNYDLNARLVAPYLTKLISPSFSVSLTRAHDVRLPRDFRDH